MLDTASAVSETSLCLDLLTQRVCEVQKTLTEKQAQLQDRQKQITQLQVRFPPAFVQLLMVLDVNLTIRLLH